MPLPAEELEPVLLGELRLALLLATSKPAKAQALYAEDAGRYRLASMNPYDWKRNQPSVEVPRSEVVPVATELRQGGSGVLLAGRGMGKSVFLQQLQRELERLPSTRVVLFEEPPAELTVSACFEALGRRLGVDASGALNAREVIDAHRAENGREEHLVLLYDELDRYARSPSPGVDPPGRSYFNSLETMRRNVRQVGILATGSVGVFAYRDVLGSSFLARADKVRIPPFDTAAIRTLARPFDMKAHPLPLTTIEALYLASGGNPALATYGLGALWDVESPTERAVAESFLRFKDQNSEFLRDFQMAFADPAFSEAPQRAWDLICRGGGSVTRAALKEACPPVPQGALQLDAADVLDILQAAGLVRVSGSTGADPVLVRPVASVLSLPSVSPAVPHLRQRLVRDLEELLDRLHVASADFFRPGTADGGKQLVPESVFAAFLAMGMEFLGWQVEREALHVAGRTDLKLRWNGSSEVAIVEVKIWGRNDYRDVLNQVASYWSSDSVAGSVVMLTDAEIRDWPEAYREKCLDRADHWDVPPPTPESKPSVGSRRRSVSKTPEGVAVEVDHFLLRLPRGR